MATTPPAWFAELTPVDGQAFPSSSLLTTRADELASLLGPGPAGWAVELGATMAARIISAIPELAVDVIAREVRKGCEAVALGALAALASGTDVAFAAMPEVFTGPVEVVARGIGVEPVLRSIHVAHAAATEVLMDTAERVIPEFQRFREMRRISDLLFSLVDIVTTRMSGEYARAHEEWLTSAAALRMETVEDILNGADIPLGRAARVLGYDLSRWHLAVIAWTGGDAPADPEQLRAAATGVLAAAGCVSNLVLPVGAHLAWAWGSRTVRAPALAETSELRPAPGIRISTGLPGLGLDGFRRSHVQAAHGARVGAASTRGEWLVRYDDVDVVAMLSADLSAASEFVARELGALAGASDSVAVVRHTLKCYLDRDRSLAKTAEHLHIARNTVAYRVQRAEQLRERPITERRLALHAALTLVGELGGAVLPISSTD